MHFIRFKAVITLENNATDVAVFLLCPADTTMWSTMPLCSTVGRYKETRFGRHRGAELAQTRRGRGRELYVSLSPLARFTKPALVKLTVFVNEPATEAELRR